MDIIPGLKGFGTDTRAAYGAVNDPVIFIVTDLTNGNGTPGNSTRNGTAVKTGSFQEAINYNPPANTGVIILFEVSGIITYEGYLTVDGSYTIIAGETAPSPGILLKGSTMNVNGHDILVHHIRIRPGDHAGNVNPDSRDGMNVNVGAITPYNVVVDHCSVSWAIDENMGVGGSGIHDVTISNTIASEGLSNSLHTKGEHSMGLICGGGIGIGIINNLFAHNTNRNPYVTNIVGVAADVLIANNLIYNAGDINTNYATRATIDHFNLVGNVVIGGANSGIYASDRLPTLLRDQHDDSEMYIADNQCDDGVGTYTQTSANDWSKVRMETGSTVETTCKVLTIAFAYPTGYTPMASTAVESYVLDHVGARPADQDSVDSRIINEVLGDTGSIIDSPSEVGGYPTLAENTITLSIPSNPHVDSGDGYTNLEKWLHGLAADVEGAGDPPSPYTRHRGILHQKPRFNQIGGRFR